MPVTVSVKQECSRHVCPLFDQAYFYPPEPPENSPNILNDRPQSYFPYDEA